MQAFSYSDTAAELLGQFPGAVKIKNLVHDYSISQNESFVRLWLCEGIPYAFRKCPFLYQISREWIAGKIGVAPQEISIVGSSRLGYSLKPFIGEPDSFGPESDLDYVVISKRLFDACAEHSLRFVDDVEKGLIVASDYKYGRCWPEDIEFIKRNIPRGFVNGGKVPNVNRYEFMRRLESDFWQLSGKLKLSDNCPTFTKATFRVYNTHASFTSQLSLNLKRAMLNSK